MGPDDQVFGPEWVRAYFQEVDRMNPDGLLAWYGDAPTFRFANQPAAEGRDAILQVLQQFYASIKEMRHKPLGIWTDAESGAMEAMVDFTTGDGRRVEIPAVSVLRLRGGRVHDFRFVMDAAPLQGA
jgi:ketosteroid isomerase-like protein